MIALYGLVPEKESKPYAINFRSSKLNFCEVLKIIVIIITAAATTTTTTIMNS